jgi:hypothetical protein
MVESVSGAPQRHGFDSFEDLVAYLRAELDAQPSDGGQGRGQDAGDDS